MMNEYALTQRRAKDAKRKRDERARKKSPTKADSLKQFRAASLATANPQKLAEWRARQEEILDTLHWMRQVIGGTYNVNPADTECYVSIEEGDEDIKQMLREYGEVSATAVLLLPLSQTLAHLRKDGENHPTSIYARFGILTALPDYKVHEWKQFMARRQSQPGIEMSSAANKVSTVAV
jgi:hypothetical protein